jgi:hypothetical protein
VANNYSYTISILKNDGSGIFTQTSTVSVSSSPISVISADVDSDGVMDLIVAGNNAVSILKNSGSGVFAETSVLSSGISSFSVAAADVDNDGDVDLAVTNSGSTSVLIFKNNGSGTFTQTSSATVGNNPRAITAADIDNDGDLDLATADYYSDIVSILTNNGSGTFTRTSTVTVGTNPRSITSADLDGDGAMELAVANLNSNTISILKSIMTDVKDYSDIIPTDFSLSQNYPNPFNPSATINYQLPRAGYVKLSVNDMLGREIAILVDGMKQPGYYSIKFEGKNVTSGIYFARLTVQTSSGTAFMQTKKIVLLK